MAVTPFDPAVLAPDPVRRRVVLELLAAGLDAIEPAAAVRRSLRGAEGPATVLAFGKAAAAMAQGAAAAMGPVRGVAVAPGPAEVPPGVELVAGGHPVPDLGSARGARLVLDAAERAGPGDLVVVLVSGGASALAELPAPGLELVDLIRVNELLLRSGAPIEAVNAVRKHLSAFKGGRLAEALAPARVVTLVLSDVVGSPLDVVASGPTVPDPTTYGDALAVLARHGIGEAVPPRVRAHLAEGAAGGVPETPKRPPPGLEQTIAVVADGAVAAEAVAAAGRAHGLRARVVSTSLTGEAREAAARVVAAASPGVAVYAGETIVTVRGDGTGGRNQELALAAGLAVDGDGTVVVATLGTDGVDGPTTAAGAVVDGGTAGRAREAGLDPGAHLERNDAHPLLAATCDLLITGPTGTNAGDVTLAWTA